MKFALEESDAATEHLTSELSAVQVRANPSPHVGSMRLCKVPGVGSVSILQIACLLHQALDNISVRSDLCAWGQVSDASIEHLSVDLAICALPTKV